MAQTFSSALHLSSAAVAGTATPLSLVIWSNNTGGQNKRLFALNGSGADTNWFGIALDITSGATNKVSAYRKNSSTADQALSTTAITSGSWQHYTAVFASNTSSAAYLNGGSKGTSTANVVPSGLNSTLISGRGGDFSFGISGQAAHAAIWTRALTDTEIAYLGAGGNPRAVKGCVSYWKLTSGESPVVDQIGTNDLTPSGTIGAGTSAPNVQTFRAGAAIGNLTYTQGTAITAINLSAGNTFDDVSSAFTATLCQLGTATNLTTVSTSLTAAREIPATSASGIAAGDYVKITSGGTPTRVLSVNGTTVLVSDDQTCSSSAALYRYPVNTLTVPGLSITSNSFSGTPTSAATNSLCLFRATCTGNSALLADSDVFTLTVNSSGGGGGGGLLLPAGVFSGGMIGG